VVDATGVVVSIDSLALFKQLGKGTRLDVLQRDNRVCCDLRLSRLLQRDSGELRPMRGHVVGIMHTPPGQDVLRGFERTGDEQVGRSCV
jgi:hypothetical protein